MSLSINYYVIISMCICELPTLYYATFFTVINNDK